MRKFSAEDLELLRIVAGHIALAVDTPSGLLAPVIADAGQLSLAQISERSRTLLAQSFGRFLGCVQL